MEASADTTPTSEHTEYPCFADRFLEAPYLTVLPPKLLPVPGSRRHQPRKPSSHRLGGYARRRMLSSSSLAHSGRSLQPEPPKAEVTFHFFGLPPELRNLIYELAVDVRCYTPLIRTLGPRDQAARVLTRGSSTEEAIAQGYPVYEYVFVGHGPRVELYRQRSAPTPLPGILEVSKQTRSEAMPLFCNVNAFVLYDQPLSTVLKWLQRSEVGPHTKHLSTVVWQGGFRKSNVAAAFALRVYGQTGLVPPGAMRLMFSRRGHVGCAIGVAVQNFLVQNAQVDAAFVEQAGPDEMLELVHSDARKWWMKYKGGFRSGDYRCPHCEDQSAEKTDETGPGLASNED